MAASVLAALLAASRPPAGHLDEMVDPSGRLPDAWAAFARAAGDLSPGAIALAAGRVARQIQEHGVSYNVYASIDGPSRPWSLDVLPLIVSLEDWALLDGALRQQARLMNAIAADLYGPQRLVRDGIVPPAVVFRHSGFHRACHGVTPSRGVFAHIVAFDLAHAPDGRWHLVGLRVQAPSGLGYALENRATIARVLPDALGAVGVRPLTPFFNAVQQGLVRAAPAPDGVPHVVILTPGPLNETYFEHAYLAREFGWPLVQGADLLVRDDLVFLKTVSGLRPIDVIWRRVDDDYCDPLELRADSMLGVPGLVQAWRAGRVTLANAFGLGVLESPAIFACLPRICQYLFGESLRLPVPPAWWCGEPGGRAAGFAHLDTGIIKRTFPEKSRPLVFGEELDPEARAQWAAAITAAPEDYVIQQGMAFSHAPVWQDGTFRSRPLMLRVFLVADGQGDYHLLPGGLTRVAGDDRQIVSGQRGGNSKDTWVLSATPVGRDAGAAPAVRHDTTPGERTTSSRTAEHLFWLGRYAERSENTARLVRALLGRMSEVRSRPAAVLATLVRSCRSLSLLKPEPDTHEPGGAELDIASLESVLVDGVYDPQGRRGLAFNVSETWRVAGAVRERLSTDNWRVLTRLHQRLSQTPTVDPAGALEFLDDVIVSLVAVGGLEMAHMTRDDGWRFLSLGRHLERLTFVADTLDDMMSEGASDDPVLLDWLLDLSDSVLTYRARHLRQPEWEAVLDLLFFDERNPRSAMFQVGKIAAHVRLLPGAAPIDAVDAVDALLQRGRRRARHDQQVPLFDQVGNARRLPRQASDVAARVSDGLTRRYFSHVYDVAHSTTGR